MARSWPSLRSVASTIVTNDAPLERRSRARSSLDAASADGQARSATTTTRRHLMSLRSRRRLRPGSLIQCARGDIDSRGGAKSTRTTLRSRSGMRRVTTGSTFWQGHPSFVSTAEAFRSERVNRDRSPDTVSCHDNPREPTGRRSHSSYTLTNSVTNGSPSTRKCTTVAPCGA
jgi:hypothetical protein